MYWAVDALAASPYVRISDIVMCRILRRSACSDPSQKRHGRTTNSSLKRTYSVAVAPVEKVPETAPRLLACIDGACDGEVNRGGGFDYQLLPPEAAIDPSEDEVSINAAIAMRVTFAHDSPAVGAPRSVGWRSSTCRIECPQLRH